MSLSRRNLLRSLGAGAIVGAAAPALRGFPLAPATEAALWGNSPWAPQPGGATAADPILLYRNENPYGPSEKVLAVLRESAASGNRYPRTEYDTLVDQLAALHKVRREQTANIEVADVPLNKLYAHDLPTMLDRATTSWFPNTASGATSPTASTGA